MTYKPRWEIKGWLYERPAPEGTHWMKIPISWHGLKYDVLADQYLYELHLTQHRVSTSVEV